MLENPQAVYVIQPTLGSEIMFDYRKVLLDALATLGFKINCYVTTGYTKTYRLMLDNMGNQWMPEFLTIETTPEETVFTFFNGARIQFKTRTVSLFLVHHPYSNSLQTDDIYAVLKVMHEILLQSNLTHPVYFKDQHMTLRCATRENMLASFPTRLLYQHIPLDPHVIGVRKLSDSYYNLGGLYYINYKNVKTFFKVDPTNPDIVFYIRSEDVFALVPAGQVCKCNQYFSVYKTTWSAFCEFVDDTRYSNASIQKTEACEAAYELLGVQPIWLDFCELTYSPLSRRFKITANHQSFADVYFETKEQLEQQLYGIQLAVLADLHQHQCTT